MCVCAGISPNSKTIITHGWINTYSSPVRKWMRISQLIDWIHLCVCLWAMADLHHHHQDIYHYRGTQTLFRIIELWLNRRQLHLPCFQFLCLLTEGLSERPLSSQLDSLSLSLLLYFTNNAQRLSKEIKVFSLQSMDAHHLHKKRIY